MLRRHLPIVHHSIPRLISESSFDAEGEYIEYQLQIGEKREDGETTICLVLEKYFSQSILMNSKSLDPRQGFSEFSSHRKEILSFPPL